MLSLLSEAEHRTLLAQGLRVTLLLFAVAWVGAITVACAFAALRDSRWPALRLGVAGLIDYHRNVPGVVQVFLWYFGISALLPGGMQRWINRHDGEFLLASLALALYAAAYMAEDLRSGFRAVPPGQREAAAALGLSRWQVFGAVLLPQALRVALPPLVNQTLALFKATTLAMTIGAGEMLAAAVRLENITFRTFAVFGLVSIAYLLGSWTIMAGGHALARRYPPPVAQR